MSDKRESIEEVKAEAERLTLQRFEEDKRNNPGLWATIGKPVQSAAEPPQDPKDSKKEGK